MGARVKIINNKILEYLSFRISNNERSNAEWPNLRVPKIGNFSKTKKID